MNASSTPVEAAVASCDRAKFVTLADAYRPVFRTWDQEAWKAALASQVLVQGGPKRMISWSSPYILIPLLTEDAKAESDGTAQLRARLSGAGPISAAQQDHLFQVISLLRRFNDGMNVSSLVFMYTAAQRGLTLTAKQKRALLAEARQKYGACVSEPAPERLNAKSQLDYYRRAG